MELDHPLLDAQEEARLLCLAQAGDANACQELVEKNQLLVRWRALRFYHSRVTGDQELDDLQQWGNIGLLRAVDKWNPKLGKRFSTLAVWWIDESIRRQGMLSGNSLKLSYRDTTRLLEIQRLRSRLLTELGREPEAEEIAPHLLEVRKLRARLLTELGREPTAEEIALKVAAMVEFVRGLLQTLADGVSRLDKTSTAFDCDNPSTLVELIPDPEMGPAERAEQRVVAGQIRDAMQVLSAREREIISRRYWCSAPDTLAAIAKDLRIPYQYVQQLEQRALDKLREQIGAWA